VLSTLVLVALDDRDRVAGLLGSSQGVVAADTGAGVTVAESFDEGLMKLRASAFDLIVLDAFSSDAVPVHLLTSEAFGQYLDKLAPGGFIAFHISNRYLDLASVVAEVAATRGLVTFVRLDGSATDEDMRRDMRSTSLVAAVARNEHDLRSLKGFAGWDFKKADGSVRPWTDDYSNILAALWRRQSAR